MTTINAGGVINVLISSNIHWARRVTDLHQYYFPDNAQSHHPPVLWIDCSDARVPETLITDSPPGRILVHRTIANQFVPSDNSAQAVLDFAVDTLAVKHVIVVGHTNCHGIETAYDNAQSGKPPPTGTPLERLMAPLTQRIIDMNTVGMPRDEGILIATKENVKMQVETIRGQMASNSTVTVHGWLYNLECGLLERFWN